MKKFLTGLLIIALTVLFSAGMLEQEVHVPVSYGIVFPAGVKETGSDQEKELSSINAAENYETPPGFPAEDIPKANETEIVKDAISTPETAPTTQFTAQTTQTQTSQDHEPPKQEKVETPAPGPEPDPQPVKEDPVQPTVTVIVPAGNEHVHDWVDTVIAYHDAVTHTVHHDAVTEQRWVSVPVKINHYYCDVCRKEFPTQEEAYAHEDATYAAAMDANDMSLIHSGHSMITETVNQGYYETVVIQEAYDEVITDSPAWEEHILRCSICGATK